MTRHSFTRPPTLRWQGGIEGHLEILDQRHLPARTAILRLDSTQDVWQAIRSLAVRGAPAIGVAAAYALVLATREIPRSSGSAFFFDRLQERGDFLKSARPTAVNLQWAVDWMIQTALTHRGLGIRLIRQRMLHEARAIHKRDLETCMAIGRHGLAFITPGIGILTHCNAGALATSDHGTALAILYEARCRGLPFHVFADETRPLLQGARLTTWELLAAGIDVTLICDNMAAVVMQQKKIDLVLVGADRIAANGDTANKIGTYGLALLARAHGIPFVVAAPCNTFDLSLRRGDGIPIEQRDPDEVTTIQGKRIAPAGVKAFNPAFDVTPARLIRAIVTERGVISPVNAATIRQLHRGR